MTSSNIHIIDRQRFGDRRQRRFAISTPAGARQKYGWNPILLPTMAAGADDRHANLRE
jgi:hypothetical protein